MPISHVAELVCTKNFLCLFRKTVFIQTDHTKDIIITQIGLFVNEAGPGVLQSSFRESCTQEEYQRHKVYPTEGVMTLSSLNCILTVPVILGY